MMPVVPWMWRPLYTSNRGGHAVLAIFPAVLMICWRAWRSEALQDPELDALDGASTEGWTDGGLQVPQEVSLLLGHRYQQDTPPF